MKDIVSVTLENDMDLILAHKRVMKLSEMTGFSLIHQTSIATAVSEIARCAIENGKGSCLKLGIDGTVSKKYLVASIEDPFDFSQTCIDAFNYARRLVGNVELQKNAKGIAIVMKQQLNFSGIFTPAKLELYVDYFKNEPPISPYDELRRKNLLLQEFAERLKDNEDEYRILTNSLPLMMFTLDNRGTLTFSNKWLEEFLGTIPKDITAASWQNIIHPDDFSAFAKTLTACFQQTIVFKGQYRLREKDTTNFFWHLITALPLKTDKDRIQKWIGFMVDIHGHKLVEKTLKDNSELREVQEMLVKNQSELQSKIIDLNRSNYELEQFAHVATHDLQEPLRKLFFYMDTLKIRYKDKLDTAGIDTLKNMTSAVQRMKELITDLLHYSQLNKQDLEITNVNLSLLIQDIKRDFEITIQEKGATVEIDSLPIIQGNELRLRQLFSNLISNALKYSRKEIQPHVQISGVQSGNLLSIQIKDNGIGFEPKYKEQIFGLFERLHTRDKYPGTGIGLSICKRIVELHQGAISATSVPDQYTIFEIELPITRKTAVA